MKIFVKIFMFLYFSFVSVFFGYMVRYGNFIPLGNSCALPKIDKLYSPHKTAYIIMKSYLCGLLQNQYITIEVFNSNQYITSVDVNENRFSSMNIEQVDINWSGHPLTTRSNPLPKIEWKDDNNVDIYVKTKVKFGTQTINNTIDSVDPKTNLTLQKPFNIIVHYERED